MVVTWEPSVPLSCALVPPSRSLLSVGMCRTARRWAYIDTHVNSRGEFRLTCRLVAGLRGRADRLSLTVDGQLRTSSMLLQAMTPSQRGF
jgi:hypothetical protein